MADSPVFHPQSAPNQPIKIFAYSGLLLIYTGYILAGSMLFYAGEAFGVHIDKSLAQGAGQLLFMLGPCLLLMLWAPISTSDILRLRGRTTFLQWTLGIAGLVCIQAFAHGMAPIQEALIPEALLEIYTEITVAITDAYQDILGGAGPLDAVKALVIGALIPAIAEELLFRGFFQRLLEYVYSARKAIIISGLSFAILHLNPIDGLALIAIGAFIGLTAYYTQSLALPIVIHAGNNAIAVTLLYTLPDDAASGAFGALPLEIAIPMALFGAVGLYVLAVFFVRISSPKIEKDSADRLSEESENSDILQ